MMRCCCQVMPGCHSLHDLIQYYNFTTILLLKEILDDEVLLFDFCVINMDPAAQAVCYEFECF